MFKPQFSDYSKPKANSLSALPIAELSEICTFGNYDIHVDSFISQHGLKLKTWFYPQALAHVAKWRLSRNESGHFSGKNLVIDNCKNDEFNKGLYWILMSKHRAVVKQYVQAEYCSMVPLVLSAFKKHCDTSYSSWDPEELHFVVDPKLLEAMTTVPPTYSKDELLQFRVDGLVVGETSKIRPGEAKNPVTSYNLHRLEKELSDGRVGMGGLPPLVRMMLCQTWCAHPQNRNHYMILDPLNWDRVPEPLIDDSANLVQKSIRSDLDSVWN